MNIAERNVRAVLEYFDGCNTGERASFESTLDWNVVHYFLPPVHKPIHGADHLIAYWLKFRSIYQPVWRIDHTIANDHEVVSEWSCDYLPKGAAERRMFRGTEWYVMRDFRIFEVRAYYEYDDKRDCELTGFPYQSRDYLINNA